VCVWRGGGRGGAWRGCGGRGGGVMRALRWRQNQNLPEVCAIPSPQPALITETTHTHAHTRTHLFRRQAHQGARPGPASHRI